MVYRLTDFELDPTCFELRRAGQPVPVEPQVLELLLYLVANRDRAVTRAELFETLWRGRVVGEAALNSRIKEARSAIGDDGRAQAQIRTLHRMGYRFVGPVEELRDVVRATAPATAVAAVPSPSPSTPPPSTRPPASSPLRLARVALGLVLAVGAFAMLPGALRENAAPAPAAASVAAPAGAHSTPSLAVLPFTNLSADAAQDYFADGVGVEILNVLSRVPDLRVTGRISSARFKGRDEPLASIGATLGVAHLLTGSVRRAGDRVRINVELVDAASGYQLWTESYERQLGDILDVQAAIAERVAVALEVKLGLGQSGELGMTRNVAAYDEFLRGVWQFDQFTADSLALAVEHMQRAIALDPGFARAWSYLYCIYSDGRAIVPGRSVEWRRKSLEVLEKAHNLAPDSPFVHILLAREEMRSGNPLEARAKLDALPSGYWTADRYVTRDVIRALFAIGTGHQTAAVEMLERARAADPLSPVVAYFLVLAHAGAGRAADAFAESARGFELAGARFNSVALLVALGTRERQEIERRVAALPHDSVGHRAISETLVRHLDDVATARAELRRLAAEPSAPADFRNVLIAQWAGYFGDAELALELVSRMSHDAVDEGALWWPALHEMRLLPEFKDLARREGLVDYWLEHGWPDLCKPTTAGDFQCR